MSFAVTKAVARSTRGGSRETRTGRPSLETSSLWSELLPVDGLPNAAAMNSGRSRVEPPTRTAAGLLIVLAWTCACDGRPDPGYHLESATAGAARCRHRGLHGLLRPHARHRAHCMCVVSPRGTILLGPEVLGAGRVSRSQCWFARVARRRIPTNDRDPLARKVERGSRELVG